MSGSEASVAFLEGGGEMAALMRAHDWAATPLGPLEAWPQSLRTTTALLLRSPVPLVLLWGADGVMIYNDAYSVFAGGRHPRLLGSKVREGWPEVADFNDNVMKVGLAGGTLAYKDMELTLYRTGRAEQVFMNLDYSPVPDESGRPAGVIAIVVETTERVAAERRAAAEVERQRRLFEQMPGFVAVLEGPEHRFTYANDAYTELAGGRAVLGLTVREAFPDLEGQGFFELLDQVYASGERFVTPRIGVELDRPDGSRVIDLLYEPITGADGVRQGIFVGGYDVTEAARTSDALRDSEARYRALFTATSSGFCIVQMKFETLADGALKPVDYMIVEGNRAFETLTGLGHVDGRWVSEVAPGLEQHWFDLYGGVALTGEAVRFEQPAGVFGRWYDVEAFRIGEPEARRVAILFTDVSERRAAEARQTALIALNDAIRDLSDPAEIAEVSAEILGRTLNVSRAGYGVMDTVAETITIERDYNAPGIESLAGVIRFRDFGSYIENLSRGETVAIADAAEDPRTRDTAGALAGIGATALLNMPLLEHGEVVALVFANNATPRVWSDGDVQLVREVAERVRVASERARATSALSQSEARLRFLDALTRAAAATRNADEILSIITRMVGEHLGVSVCAYADMDADQDGFTIRGDWAAAGSASIVGHYSLADFGRLAVRELGAGRPLIVNDNAEELAPEEAATFQAIGLRATVCMPLIKAGRLIALMAIHDRAPRRWTTDELLTISEVTARCWAHIERMRAETELRALNEDLEARVAQAIHERLSEQARLAEAEEALRQAQKMETIGQLTGGVAHDFNNLLTPIVGTLDMLNQRLDGDERAKRLTAGAIQAADRARVLVQRLLAFSRRQHLQPQAVDVKALVEGMADLIGRSLGPQIRLDLDLAEGLAPAHVDPNQLELALLNLAVNARDAMAGDGVLTVRAFGCEKDGRARVCVSVTDTGTGMDAETLARAVEPFFTTKEVGKGTGLGLSAVHGLAVQSGGEFSLSSPAGGGVVATLCLPVSPETAVARAAREEAVEEAGTPLSVLLVDDEDLVRAGAADMLTEAGHAVTEAGSPADALALIAGGLRPDVLVTDYAMPGMTGAELAQRARELVPNLPVLMITGYAALDDREAVGIVRLAKPFRQPQLAAAVRDLAAG